MSARSLPRATDLLNSTCARSTRKSRPRPRPSREAEAAADLAALTRDRQAALSEKGHVSSQALDQAEASLTAARARVAAAQAQVDQLEVRRDLSVLTAPFDGVVTARHVDEGAIVAPGAPIIDLVESGALELKVGLPLAQAEDLVPGASYDLTVDGRTVPARLRAATGIVDRAAQTVSAVFDVDSNVLSPGQVGRLHLKSRIQEDGFWAPLDALSEGRRGLWTVMAVVGETDGDAYVLEPRVVDVLYTEGDQAYVRGALSGGELILAEGRNRVVAGQRVTPASRARVLATLESTAGN